MIRLVLRHVGAVLLAAALSGCIILHERRIDAPPPDPGFPGLAQILGEADTGRLAVILVHGGGPDTPNYSERLRAGIIQRLGYGEPPRCGGPVKLPVGAELWICNYKKADEPELRFYELHWAPLTQPWKHEYFRDDEAHASERLLLNRELKRKLLNERFADAVLYAGKFGRHMRQAVESALCFALNDEAADRVLKGEREVLCPDIRLTATTVEPGKRRQIALITWSLGSKMVFDVLDRYYWCGQAVKAEAWRAEAAQGFVNQTRAVFMLSNQLPFLALAEVDQPFHPGMKAAEPSARAPLLPSGFVRLLDERSRLKKDPIELVAITDPNDLLGYAVPREQIPPVTLDHLRVTNVLISLANWGVLGIAANPITAHTGHDRNNDVLTMIACGEPPERSPHPPAACHR